MSFSAFEKTEFLYFSLSLLTYRMSASFGALQNTVFFLSNVRLFVIHLFLVQV